MQILIIVKGVIISLVDMKPVALHCYFILYAPSKSSMRSESGKSLTETKKLLSIFKHIDYPFLVAALKHGPVDWYSFAIFTFAGPLGLSGSDIQRQNTTQAGARCVCVCVCVWGGRGGVGGLRNVAFSSISHEQTQSNRVCCFPTVFFFFFFKRIPFSSLALIDHMI